MREADRLLGEELSFLLAKLRFAHLKQFQTPLEGALEAGKHHGDAVPVGVGDRIFAWQGKRSEHRSIGGQHRRGHGGARDLPRDRLVFARMRLAAPRMHPKKAEANGAVGISENPREPRISRPDVDAELLVELSRERGGRRLAPLELAAGKFPVAGVDLARGTLGEEESAVGALDYRRRYLDHFFFACRPAQSRAN